MGYEEHVPRKRYKEITTRKISVSEFPQFGLIDRITAEEEEQNLLGRSYTETQNELEELNQDPYTIEREPDLTEEQEEYFRRICHEWIDPGSHIATVFLLRVD